MKFCGEVRPNHPIDLGLLGAGMVLSCALFVLGMTLAPFTGIPGPIMMIIAAVALKLTKIMPAEMELGAYQINKFMSTNLTFAILVAMGALLVTWHATRRLLQSGIHRDLHRDGAGDDCLRILTSANG